MTSSDDAGPRLQVFVGDERGCRVPVPGLGRWLALVAPPRVRASVTIALVSDSRIRALNRRYRRVDRVTDVLSFPASVPGGARSTRHRSSFPELGDIVIARGLARRQAAARGHSTLTELRVLALHGLLHLLGYDHEEGTRMRDVEDRLRRVGGLREGLIERSERARLRPKSAGSGQAAGSNSRRRGARP
jgi:probable rRNA maturation factor